MQKKHIQKNIRFDTILLRDIENIANEQNQSTTETIKRALEFYRDYYYMENKATIINKDILSIIKAQTKHLEHNINHTTNKFLSELVLQQICTNFIISSNLEISQEEIKKYRLMGLNFMKENNRILRLDELTDNE